MRLHCNFELTWGVRRLPFSVAEGLGPGQRTFRQSKSDFQTALLKFNTFR